MLGGPTPNTEWAVSGPPGHILPNPVQVWYAGLNITWLVPTEPFIEDSVGESVQQDEDGIIRGEVSLSACAVEEEVGQVVEAADHWIIHPLGSAVALKEYK